MLNPFLALDAPTMSPTLQFILQLGGAAVLVKILDMAYNAYQSRSESARKAKLAKLTENIETKKLTLDEVSFVIRSLQDEVTRLTARVASLSTEVEQRDSDYGRLFREHEELADKYAALLRRQGELARRFPSSENLTGTEGGK